MEFPKKHSHPDGRGDYCNTCMAHMATMLILKPRKETLQPTVSHKVCACRLAPLCIWCAASAIRRYFLYLPRAAGQRGAMRVMHSSKACPGFVTQRSICPAPRVGVSLRGVGYEGYGGKCSQ